MGLQEEAKGLRVPHAPRTPHVPHSRAIVTGVILALAGAAASGALNNRQNTPDSGIVTANENPFAKPYGDPVSLEKDSSGNITIKFGQRSQLFKAESNAVSSSGDNLIYFRPQKDVMPSSDLETGDQTNDVHYIGVSQEIINEAFFVPVFGKGSKDFPQAADNIPRGDVWYKLTDEFGQPINKDGQILSADEQPILTDSSWITLDIPLPVIELATVSN